MSNLTNLTLEYNSDCAFLRRYWNSTRVTTTWKAKYDDFLIAKKTNTYNETSTFVACQAALVPTMSSFRWQLFLATSNATPTAADLAPHYVDTRSCVKTSLYIQTPPTWP